MTAISDHKSPRSRLHHERGLNGCDVRLALRELRDRPHVPAVTSRFEAVGAAALSPSNGEHESWLIHSCSEHALRAAEELELVGRCIR
jgi:hypothetical protein